MGILPEAGCEQTAFPSQEDAELSTAVSENLDRIGRNRTEFSRIPTGALQQLLEEQLMENEKLRRKLKRLQEEKVIATEVFTETISKYEADISEMENMINTLRNRRRSLKQEESTARANSLLSQFQLAVPAKEATSSVSHDRRPFISVASSFMTGWISGTTTKGQPHRTRSFNQSIGPNDNALTSPRQSQANLSGASSENSPSPSLVEEATYCGEIPNPHPRQDDIKIGTSVESEDSCKFFEQNVNPLLSFPMIGPDELIFTSNEPRSSPTERVNNDVTSHPESPRPSGSKQGGGGNAFWKSLIGMKPQSSPMDSRIASDPREKYSLEAWAAVLNNWEAQKNSKRMHKMLQHGVPYSLRGALWKKAIGDRLLITRVLYESIVHRVCLLREFLMRTSKRYKTRLEETLGSAWVADDELRLASFLKSPAVDQSSGFNSSTKNNNSNVHVFDTPQTVSGDDGVASSASRHHSPEPRPPPGAHERTDSTVASMPEEEKKVCSLPPLATSQQQAPRSSCGLCSSMWSSSIISAFETISVDLHRTLPRLGVINPMYKQSAPNRSSEITREENDRGKTSEEPSNEQHQINEEGHPLDISNKDGLETLSREQLPSITNEMIINPLDRLDLQHHLGGAASILQDRLKLTRSANNKSTRSTEAGVRPLALCGRDGLELYSRLRLILEAFVLLRPDIGYVQGMGFLAAMLLLYIDDDYDAFSCFANLLTRQSLFAFYTFDLRIVHIYFKAFDALFQEKLPAMAAALNEAQIPSSQFLVDWMYTLFTRCLPFNIVSRIWDLFLVHGDLILYQTALGMLKYYQVEDPNSDSVSLERLSTFLSSSSTSHFESMQPERFLEISASVAPQRDRLLRIMRSVQQTDRRRGSHCSSPRSTSGYTALPLLKMLSQQRQPTANMEHPVKLNSSSEEFVIGATESSFIPVDSSNFTTAIKKTRQHENRIGRRTNGVGTIKPSAKSLQANRHSSLPQTQLDPVDAHLTRSSTPTSSEDRSILIRNSRSHAGPATADFFPSSHDKTLVNHHQPSSMKTTDPSSRFIRTPITVMDGGDFEWTTHGHTLEETYGNRSATATFTSTPTETSSHDWFAPSIESIYPLQSKKLSAPGPMDQLSSFSDTLFQRECESNCGPTNSLYPTVLGHSHSVPTIDRPGDGVPSGIGNSTNGIFQSSRHHTIDSILNDSSHEPRQMLEHRHNTFEHSLIRHPQAQHSSVVTRRKVLHIFGSKGAVSNNQPALSFQRNQEHHHSSKTHTPESNA